MLHSQACMTCPSRAAPQEAATKLPNAHITHEGACRTCAAQLAVSEQLDGVHEGEGATHLRVPHREAQGIHGHPGAAVNPVQWTTVCSGT